MKSPLGIDTNALFSAVRRDWSEGRQSYKLPKESLSPREMEVCRLLVEGLAVKEVAARCNVSPKTAECHTRNLYKNLQVRSRVELARHFLTRTCD